MSKLKSVGYSVIGLAGVAAGNTTLASAEEEVSLVQSVDNSAETVEDQPEAVSPEEDVTNEVVAEENSPEETSSEAVAEGITTYNAPESVTEGDEVDQNNYTVEANVAVDNQFKNNEVNDIVEDTNTLLFDIKDGKEITPNDFISFASSNIKLFELLNDEKKDVSTTDGVVVGKIVLDPSKETFDSSRVGYDVPVEKLAEIKANEVGGNYYYRLVFNELIQNYNQIKLAVKAQAQTSYARVVENTPLTLSIKDANDKALSSKDVVLKEFKSTLIKDSDNVSGTGAYQNVQVFNRNTLESASASVLKLNTLGEIQQYKAGDIIEYKVVNQDVWNTKGNHYYVKPSETYSFTSQGTSNNEAFVKEGANGVYIPQNGTLDFTYLSDDNGVYRFRLNKDITGALPFAGFDEIAGTLKKIDSSTIDPDTGTLKVPFEVKVTHYREDGTVVSESVQTPDINHIGVWTQGDGKFVPSYVVTVRYVYEDGSKVFEDETTPLFKVGDQYTVNIPTPTKEGYTSSTNDPLTGTMVEGGKVVTYVYKKTPVEPREIPNKTTYVPIDEDETIENKVIEEGKVGSIDPSTNKVIIPPVNKVIGVGVISKTNELIPYKTVRIFNPNLPAGEEKTVQNGKEGSVTRTYRDKINPDTGERLNDKELIDESTVTPIDEIIEYGKKEIPNKTTYVPIDEDETVENKVIEEGKVGEIDPNTNRVITPPVDKVIGVGVISKTNTPVPYKTVRIFNPNLPVGTEKTVQNGKEGSITRTYRDKINPETGERLNDKELIDEKAIDSVDEVIEYGPQDTIKLEIPKESKNTPSAPVQPQSQVDTTPALKPSKVLPNTGEASSFYLTATGILMGLLGLFGIKKKTKDSK